MKGVRAATFEGAVQLALREGAGVLIRVAGVFVVTALIGPSAFGVYSGSLAIVTVLTFVAQMGSEVFLIRARENPSGADVDAVFSVLVVSSCTVAALAFAGSLAASHIVTSPSVVEPFQAMLLSIPLVACWAPAQAMLERSFRYRAVAMLEVGGDIALYGVAVPLALAGAGVWAPVTGFLVWRAWHVVVAYWVARHRPRWRWSRRTARELVGYGVRYSPAGLLGQAEYLVNPVVVGSMLGAAAVGQVAFTIRLVETLSFVLKATWRLSIVALSKVQDDLVRLRRGFEDALSLQVIAQAPLLALFALLTPWLIPALFGEAWDPVVELYPYAAVAALFAAVLNVHYALLYVRRLDMSVVALAALKLALLSVTALVAVPLFGLTGFGVAMLTPALVVVPAWLAVRRRVFPYSFTRAARWLVAFGPAVFIPLVGRPWGVLLLVPIPVVVMLPSSRSQLRGYASLLRSRGRESAAG